MERPQQPKEDMPNGRSDLTLPRAPTGKISRAKEGRNPGFKPPYGYLCDPTTGRFLIEPTEASVVRRIFLLQRQGSGSIRIARRLNEDGVQFRGGRMWSPSTVQKILSNPIYQGELRYGQRRRNPDYGNREGEHFYRTNDKPLSVKGVVPAIVSCEEWIAAQTIRSSRPAVSRRSSGRALSSRYLLSGLACCRCGKGFVGQAARSGGYLYYCCSAQRRRGRRACSCGYIRVEEVDRVVLRRFREQLPAILGDSARSGGESRSGLRGDEPGQIGWRYEWEMADLALRIEELPVQQQKAVLRHFVRTILLFRKEGRDGVECEIVWKERDEPGPSVGLDQ